MPSLPSLNHQKLLALTLPPPSLNPRMQRILLVMALLGLGVAIAWLPVATTVLLFAGTIFLILLLVKPILSLFVLIPIIPFSPLFSIPVGSVRVGLMEIVLVAGIAAWLLQRSTGQRDQGRPGRAFILVWPFLIFLGAVSLSWLNALSIGASLVETIKWVEMLALYLFVVALLPARSVKWVVAVILITGMAQAALGLYQFVFKVGPAGFLLFEGRFLRAYGTFAQPNPYAGYLGLVLPLSLALVLWAVTTGNIHSIDLLPARVRGFAQAKPGYLIAQITILALVSLPLGLLLLGLFASQSRGGWLGFAASAAIVFTIFNKRTALLTMIAVLIGALVLLIGTFDLNVIKFNAASDTITQRFVDALSIFTITDVASIEVTDANFAAVERLAHWQAAREMWRDHPWLGVGFGNYAVIYPAYAVGRWLDPLGHAHNYLLNLGAETGLIGITTYLIFWIFTFVVLWAIVCRSDGFDRAVAIGALGIMVHLQVHNFFDNLYVQGMYLHIALVLALVSVVYQPQTHANHELGLQTSQSGKLG